MELLFGIICGLFILVLLVVVHELGHAIVARRNGVVVEEFGIGFPPRAWAKKLKNGMLFTLNWLPLGGFVRLKGEYDSARGKGEYGAAGYWAKTRILLAGVLVNWLVAALLLSVLAVTGMPRVLENQFTVRSDTTLVTKPLEVAVIAEGSPAEKAGLQKGDELLKLNDTPLSSAAMLQQQTKAHQGAQVTVTYARAGEVKTADVVLRGGSEKGGYLGVGAGQRQFSKSTWSAPIVGVVTTGQFTWETLKGLGGLLAKTTQGVVLQFSPHDQTRQEAKQNLSEAGESVAGPIGILGTLFPAAERAGLTQLTFLTAIISLTLAVMNALPIPALDGGRWWAMTIFRLIKKPLTKEREEAIQATGFLVLLGLIILVTVVDVKRFF